MYGKIFDSMYEGTLYGHWEAIVTLQQMLVLCNREGVIDMTPQAISARTSIPFEIIEKGLKLLADPDPYSRTPGDDGRRIVTMDAHRPWGWVIVNYAKYRDMKTREEKNEADRIRIAANRKALKDRDVATCSNMSQRVADVAYAAVPASVAVTTKSKALSGNPDITPPNGRDYRAESREVLDYLNRATGRAYRSVDSNLKLITARLKSGVTAVRMKEVVLHKSDQWKGDPKMDEFLRPKTLFNSTNFENYLGEIGEPTAD